MGYLVWVGVMLSMLLGGAVDGNALVRKPHRPVSYSPKYSAIVMDAETGDVMHEEDSDGIRHPASLTKMMTLYMLFDALKEGKVKLDTQMPVSSHAARQAPSKLALQPGRTVAVQTAILGLVTKSANDAAVVVAEYLGGSEEAFARQMTQKAHALGMSKTIFKNASGLPNPLQVTSARDMARLSRALYRDFPRQYTYFSRQSFTHRGVVHNNHNHLLGKVHGVDGIKTGFIAASGFNLAASAVRYDPQNKPHRLITVVLGGPNRHWRDRRVEQLLEFYFKQKLSGQSVKVESAPQAELNELIYDVSDEGEESGEAVTATPTPTTEGAAEVINVADIEAFNNSAKLSVPKGVQLLGQEGQDTLDGIVHEVHAQSEALTDDSVVTVSDQERPANWVTGSPPSVVHTPKRSSTVGMGQFHHTIQLKVENSPGKARQMANRVASQLGFGSINVQRIKRGRKSLYAPRLTGLTRNQAESACRNLSGQKCIVLA